MFRKISIVTDGHGIVHVHCALSFQRQPLLRGYVRDGG